MIGAFSDFADQGLLIPIECAVFVALLLMRQQRDALVWALVMTCGSGLLLLLKLWFERCGLTPHRILYSPSGHTMGGTMVYGGLLALFCRRYALFAIGTVLLAVGFGASRFFLGVHTAAEVTLGGLIGIGAAFALRYAATPYMNGRRGAVALTLAAVGAIAFALHGYRLGAEQWIQVIAHHALGPLFCHRAP